MRSLDSYLLIANVDRSSSTVSQPVPVAPEVIGRAENLGVCWYVIWISIVHLRQWEIPQDHVDHTFLIPRDLKK